MFGSRPPRLRKGGIRVAALTNNFTIGPDDPMNNVINPAVVTSAALNRLFDFAVESRLVRQLGRAQEHSEAQTPCMPTGATPSDAQTSTHIQETHGHTHAWAEVHAEIDACMDRVA